MAHGLSPLPCPASYPMFSRYPLFNMSFFTRWIGEFVRGLGWPLKGPLVYLQRAGEARNENQTLVTLRDLERTMDPLIASHVYNIKNSTLASLPEEILLRILELIGDDAVTLHCLRRVSRVFRRLVYEPGIWRHLPSAELLLPSSDKRRQMYRRLKKDGTCDRCKLWCPVPVRGLFRQIIQWFHLCITGEEHRCGFFESGLSRLPHCHPCGTHHDIRAFSHPRMDYRICLGRQGLVQLCEHVHISWANIEGHISKWRKQRLGNWQAEDWEACFNDFSIECQDPSHNTRCTADEAPTWPRARLQTHGDYRHRALLILEWKPHSGLDFFTLTASGQAPAAELRKLFYSYRQGAGGVLFPSCYSSPLPEMACFDTTQCRCLSYEVGNSQALTPGDPLEHENFFNELFPSGDSHFYSRSSPSQNVCVRKHWPRGASVSVCLVTIYERRVSLFHMRDDVKINPSHDWFHAMDPATYTRPDWGTDPPLCKDATCMNYYRRPRLLRCLILDKPIHHDCNCQT